MNNDRALVRDFHLSVLQRAVVPGMMLCALYLGVPSVVQAASGDGANVAGTIVDQDDVLYPNAAPGDVIVTTACLEGNPFVPDDPPNGLLATLSGCKLDTPVTGRTSNPDTNQLITVLPSNFADPDATTLNRVRTYGSGSSQRLESGVDVQAVSKDVLVGLANPALFDSTAPDDSPDVATTADLFCTSVDSSFNCVQVEPGSMSSPGTCGEVHFETDQNFCDALTGLLEGAYDLERNPLAYAIATTMTALGQPDSVTLKLCLGFQAQCRPPDEFPLGLSNVRVTAMHTQAPLVETPRVYYSRYP